MHESERFDLLFYERLVSPIHRIETFLRSYLARWNIKSRTKVVMRDSGDY